MGNKGRQIIGMLAAALVAAVFATEARAIEIVSRTGSFAGIAYSPVHAMEFSTTSIFENVSIEAPLVSTAPDVPASGTVYLTTSFGPGTTPADEIARVSLTGVEVFGPFSDFMLLFSGLTLAPATYYLIVASDTGMPGLGWIGDLAPVESAAPGAMIGRGLFNGVIASYAPESELLVGGDVLLFKVSGDPVSVPEPSTLALLSLGGVLALASARYRRRGRR